jgi:hypothetical protein
MLQISLFFTSNQPKSKMTMMSFWPSESKHKTNQTLKQQHHIPHLFPGHKWVLVTYDKTIATNVKINQKSQGEQNMT